MKKTLRLTPEQESTVKKLREALNRLPDREERARLKKAASEIKQFGRVRALANELLPHLSPYELRKLDQLIKREFAGRPTSSSKPAHRPSQPREDKERDTQIARAAHAFLESLGFNSTEADDFVGLMYYADRRTAQRKRSLRSDKKPRRK